MANDTASANLQPLLAILGMRVAENHKMERALLTRGKQPAM